MTRRPIQSRFPPWFPISRASKDYIVSCAQRVAPRQLCVEFRNQTWMRSDNHEETLNFLSAQPLVQLDELGGPVLLARGHSRADAHSRCQRIMRGRADRTGAETQASGTMVGFAAGQRRDVLW